MRRMFTKSEIKQFASEEIASNVIANPDPAGETALTGLQVGDTKYVISAEPKLYSHIIRLSKTNDSEDYPFITLNIISLASTYTKAEFEQYVKNVASFTSAQAMGHGLIAVGDNGGYTSSAEGIFLFYYDTTSSKFIARHCENVTTRKNIDFGSSIPYFDISSHEQ
ncbi:MAG: hypothetical protein J6S67_13280 [Methanobrevibacter sp.]|nr:hypothetical protein [Methanobrevibacter sp.]